MESHLWLERAAEVTRKLINMSTTLKVARQALKPVEPVLDLKLLQDLANPIATL